MTWIVLQTLIWTLRRVRPYGTQRYAKLYRNHNHVVFAARPFTVKFPRLDLAERLRGHVELCREPSHAETGVSTLALADITCTSSVIRIGRTVTLLLEL
ncbi:hypothetical protein H4582DRAFT_962430 [Lactarius indigo]|nr:hypothetical protein H4582DRAFT_962430 [Lactarius indigo]